MLASTEIANESPESPIKAAPSGGMRLRQALIACVLMLAIYQFSETTADPDLWGHVAFGQDMLRTHSLERTEIYSWTAHGNVFVNHEYGADLILGGVHRLMGERHGGLLGGGTITVPGSGLTGRSCGGGSP